MLSYYRSPCQSFERYERYGLGLARSLTVIRDSIRDFPRKGQNLAIHHGVALPAELQRRPAHNTIRTIFLQLIH
jgi:hypothetical protein